MRKLSLLFCLLLMIFVYCPLATAFDVEEINIHGYVSQGYLKTDENNYLVNSYDGSFEFTELGINFSKQFDKLRVGLQLLSRDLGEFGNNEIKLDWAMGDYHFKDYLGIRVGKIKIPLGFYNQGRDVDMLRLPVMLPAAVYDEGNRDNVGSYQGVGLYGYTDCPVLGEFDYEFYYGVMNSPIDSIWVKGTQEKMAAQISAMLHSSSISSRINSISTEYTIGGAMRWTPFDGLRLGITYSRSELDVNGTINLSPVVSSTLLLDIDSRRTVYSAEYTWNNFTFAGEYLFAELTSSGVMVMPDGSIQPRPLNKDESIGWYLQTSYQITEKFAAGIYYSEFYADKNDKDGLGQSAVGNPDYAAWHKETVALLRYDMSDNLIVKGEVHFIDGIAQIYKFNNPDGREKDWNLYALKATFSF